jgi:signal transduction histidine kinase
MRLVGRVLRRLALTLPRRGTATRIEAELRGQLEVYAQELQAQFLEGRRLGQALQESIGDLRRSRERIVMVEEAVRKDIAEILHGRVQTRLLVASRRLTECHDLMGVDIGRARAVLAEVQGEIDRIRENDVREASHLLHPSIIRIGLVPAARSLAARYQRDLEIRVHVSQDLAAMDHPFHNRIPEPVRLMAYRVLEESLNNVHRHAEASRADIRLAIGLDGSLAIAVQDNGRGFDPALTGRGLGLTSIHDRVSVIGGTWGVSPAPGGGARLWARLPLSPGWGSEPLTVERREAG